MGVEVICRRAQDAAESAIEYKVISAEEPGLVCQDFATAADPNYLQFSGLLLLCKKVEQWTRQWVIGATDVAAPGIPLFSHLGRALYRWM